MKSKIFLLSLCSLLLSVTSLSFPSVSFAANSERSSQKVFMKLDKGTNDLHAVLMALKLSENLIAKGAKVTLFLNLEAVRIADKRHPLDLSWGLSGGHSAISLFESIISKGAVVLVCPMCAKNAGIEGKDLRKGAKIPDSFDEISSAILEADKTLNY